MKGVLEPGLVDHSFGRHDHRDIAVTLEIIQHAKSHDVEPIVLGGKVAILLTDVLEHCSGRVVNLHVGGKVMLAIVFAEVVEMLISNGRDIELVVADGQEVVVDILEVQSATVLHDLDGCFAILPRRPDC